MSSGIQTLAQIRTAARQRSDQVNSPLCTDAEVNALINSSLAELYDLIITAYGNDYFVATPVSFTTDGTSISYALPDGTLYSSALPFYKLLGMDLQTANGNDSWVSLKTFKFGERNKRSFPNNRGLWSRSIPRYRLNGSNVLFDIIPASGQTMRFQYIPRCTPLVSDSDTTDGFGGWLEFVIVDVAIKMMQKEESDVSVLMAQKQSLAVRINTVAENRDVSGVMLVSDTRGEDGGSGYYGPFGNSDGRDY